MRESEHLIAWMRMKGDRDALILQYRNFVHQVAGSLINSMGLPSGMFDEYASAGYLGLVEAAERFNPSRGTDFKTFAFLRIRGAIIDSIRNSSTISGKAYQRAKALRAAHELREEEHERTQFLNPGSSPLSASEDLALTLDYLASSALVYRISAKDLEVNSASHPGNTRDPHRRLEYREDCALLRRLVKALPAKERRIVEQYYFEGKSFVMIAHENGDLSKSWVSRLHARAIKRLRIKYREAALL